MYGFNCVKRSEHERIRRRCAMDSSVIVAQRTRISFNDGAQDVGRISSKKLSIQLNDMQATSAAVATVPRPRMWKIVSSSTVRVAKRSAGEDSMFPFTWNRECTNLINCKVRSSRSEELTVGRTLFLSGECHRWKLRLINSHSCFARLRLVPCIAIIRDRPSGGCVVA